jgi:hypothetical protein
MIVMAVPTTIRNSGFLPKIKYVRKGTNITDKQVRKPALLAVVNRMPKVIVTKARNNTMERKKAFLYSSLSALIILLLNNIKSKIKALTKRNAIKLNSCSSVNAILIKDGAEAHIIVIPNIPIFALSFISIISSQLHNVAYATLI